MKTLVDGYVGYHVRQLTNSFVPAMAGATPK